MFRLRFLNFLAAEVLATSNGRFGVIWLASVVLSLGVFGLSLAWGVTHVGWLLAVPAALAAAFFTGGATFWGVILSLALILDALTRRPGFLKQPADTPSNLDMD